MACIDEVKLFFAIDNRDLDLVEDLLKKWQLLTPDLYFEYPLLFTAVAKNNLEMVKLLYTHCFQYCSQYQMREAGPYSWDCLHFALEMHPSDFILAGSIEEELFTNSLIIQELLQKNWDVTLKNSDGDSALHLAIKACKFDAVFSIINIMIEQGLALNVVNSHGQSPLHLVVLQNTLNLDIAKLLAENMSSDDFKIADLEGKKIYHCLSENENISDEDKEAFVAFVENCFGEDK